MNEVQAGEQIGQAMELTQGHVRPAVRTNGCTAEQENSQSSQPAEAVAEAEPDAEVEEEPEAGVQTDEVETDSSQSQALASLKELCDSGLLPMNLYQENVAAIHRSSRRLQQWRERLREKSQQLLERHAAMQVR